MKGIAKFGVLLLALLVGGIPVMACMLPSAQLTAEESACCKAMANQCGEMGMDSSHSCCAKVLRPQVQLLNSSQQPISFELATVSHLSMQDYSFDLSAARFEPAGFDHAPPESPPAQSSILRI